MYSGSHELEKELAVQQICNPIELSAFLDCYRIILFLYQKFFQTSLTDKWRPLSPAIRFPILSVYLYMYIYLFQV